MAKVYLIRRVIQTLFVSCFLFFSQVGFSNPAVWTQQSARFELINSCPGKSLNWVFLPGGPGLGSEYLRELATALALPGSTWLLDMPGDGSNQPTNKVVDYSQWPENLAEAVRSLDNVVLVAHSFGGMLTLSSPALQNHLSGLILIDTAPNNKWMRVSADTAKRRNIVMPSPAMLSYEKVPSNHHFKQATLSMGPLFFSPNEMIQGRRLLEHLPYNHLPYDWVIKNFNPTYQSQWVPKKIPTLIISGDEDILTPASIFKSDETFHRSNIKTILITHAGHFSWINHQREFRTLFHSFSDKLILPPHRS